MATQKELNERIGGMVADPEFRAAPMQDPGKAVKAACYDLTEERYPPPVLSGKSQVEYNHG